MYNYNARLFAAAAVLAAASLLPAGEKPPAADNARPVELINVSVEGPADDLFRDLNKQFAARYEKETGKPLSIKQLAGRSVSQAEAVRDGQAADVVSLGLSADVDLLREKGLIAEGWERRLPHQAAPFGSTFVFVVRKGNPKGVQDWQDLAKEGVEIVAPEPKKSGNGQLIFLSVWGSVIERGGSEADARDLAGRIYRQAGLELSAVKAEQRFLDKKGDVLIAREADALALARSSDGELEVVTPPISLRVGYPVAVVDSLAERRGTRDVAEAYLKYLYSDEAQETAARHGFRPVRPAAAAKAGVRLPELESFGVSDLARDWDDAQKRFFADGGLVDQIAAGKKAAAR